MTCVVIGINRKADFLRLGRQLIAYGGFGFYNVIVAPFQTVYGKYAVCAGNIGC